MMINTSTNALKFWDACCSVQTAHYAVADLLTQLGSPAWLFEPIWFYWGFVYSNAYFMRLKEQRDITNAPFTDLKALSASDFKIIAVILNAWGPPRCQTEALWRWGWCNLGHKFIIESSMGFVSDESCFLSLSATKMNMEERRDNCRSTEMNITCTQCLLRLLGLLVKSKEKKSTFWGTRFISHWKNPMRCTYSEKNASLIKK